MSDQRGPAHFPYSPYSPLLLTPHLPSPLFLATRYEIYATYFDIFVRNAFGSYYDVLREVAYSPQMAEYLSFHNNRAFASRGNSPDENFAREVMQLFSIGLYVLRDDGTQELDSAGEAIPTYDNSDIMNFARVWTGFTRQPARANLQRGKATYDNFIDPNTMRPTDRDRFPKVNLHDQYLGDGQPLCSDLPSKGFLRAGARYRLTFTFEETEPGWLAVSNAPNIKLDSASSLARALCGLAVGAPHYGEGVSSSSCSLEETVVLSEDLSCDGDECRVFDEAYVVQLTAGSSTSNVSIWYEYFLAFSRLLSPSDASSFALSQVRVPPPAVRRAHTLRADAPSARPSARRQVVLRAQHAPQILGARGHASDKPSGRGRRMGVLERLLQHRGKGQRIFNLAPLPPPSLPLSPPGGPKDFSPPSLPLT